jgi:NAD(P)-dependent dehydrogenase (short-subunit alcohol dehydrogenase family)
MAKIKELISMNNRTALITGATGGLGRVVADTFAELGASLVLVDREGSDFESLKKSLNDRWSVSVDVHACDLEQQKERLDLISKVKEDKKSLSVLVNNAAFVGSSDLEGWAVPFEEQTVETWRRAVEVNLTAVFDLSKGLFPLMRISEGASIINVSSIYGFCGPDWSLYEGTSLGNPAGYSASKGGVLQLTRWLARTIAPHVRVNAISPGGIKRGQPESFVSRYEARTPLRRMAIEDDFRGVMAYLASDMSKYVTGQNLILDGGWSI